MGKKKTVFVGLSGGVDSSVSAALLKKAGYEVVGVFIKTWHPEFLACNEEAERRDAMRVAAHLDIPFLTFDFEKEYKEGVADYMIREYKEGRTPNPDVMCNKEIKFGAFLDKAISMGADYVATGHYAISSVENVFFGLPGEPTSTLKKHSRLQEDNAFSSSDDATQDILEKKNCLLRSKDPSKDQVYFLWTLNQEQLSKILFPVGHLKKEEVRKLAKKFKLPVALKKDSQGICFLGDVDLKDFLKHYIKVEKGNVLNDKGEIIGHHDGALFHTLGERHGFTIIKKTPDDSRYYIIAKDIKNNTLTVSQDLTLARQSLGVGGNIRITNCNWIGELPKANKKYTAQVRYHGEFLTCTITGEASTFIEVIFEKPVLVAKGQSIVVYDGKFVLGGGVVA